MFRFNWTSCELISYATPFLDFCKIIFIPPLSYQGWYKSWLVVHMPVGHPARTLLPGLYYRWEYINKEGDWWPPWGGMSRRSGGCGCWLECYEEKMINSLVTWRDYWLFTRRISPFRTLQCGRRLVAPRSRNYNAITNIWRPTRFFKQLLAVLNITLVSILDIWARHCFRGYCIHFILILL